VLKISLAALAIFSLLLIAIAGNNLVFGTKQQAIAQTMSITTAIHYQSIVTINNNGILTGTRTNNNNNAFSIYKNTIYGIEIQYPSKWEKIDFAQTINGNNNNNNNNAALIAGFLSTSKNDTGILENLMIREVRLASPDITTREFSNALLSSYKEQFKNFQLVGSNASMTLSGKPAYEVVYTYGVQPNIFKTMEVWVVNGNRAYMILYNADPSDYSHYLPIIHRMISSFTFTFTLTYKSFPNMI
jgi:serine/threonine-protein kinase